jgi:hypothetical protein
MFKGGGGGKLGGMFPRSLHLKRKLCKRLEMGLGQCDNYKNLMDKLPPHAKQCRWLMQMELTFNTNLFWTHYIHMT